MGLTCIPLLYVLFMFMFFGDPHFTIHGRVVDDAGRPVAGMQVFGTIYSDWSLVPVPWTGHRSKVSAETTTDDDGRFIISGKGNTVSLSMGRRAGPSMNSRSPRTC
jgi:hypothetical protein